MKAADRRIKPATKLRHCRDNIARLIALSAQLVKMRQDVEDELTAYEKQLDLLEAARWECRPPNQRSVNYLNREEKRTRRQKDPAEEDTRFEE